MIFVQTFIVNINKIIGSWIQYSYRHKYDNIDNINTIILININTIILVDINTIIHKIKIHKINYINTIILIDMIARIDINNNMYVILKVTFMII